jgi:hypothetical protein
MRCTKHTSVRPRYRPALELLESRLTPTSLAFGLFNTGVDAAGNVLSPGATDPHYTLVANPNKGAGTDTFVLDTKSAASAPISWSPSSLGAGGDYDYRTTFTAPDPATNVVSLTGTMSADDQVTDVLINGTSTGQTGSTFTISSGIVAGINTVDFLAHNATGEFNSTHLQVEMTLSSTPKPAIVTVASFPSGTDTSVNNTLPATLQITGPTSFLFRSTAKVLSGVVSANGATPTGSVIITINGKNLMHPVTSIASLHADGSFAIAWPEGTIRKDLPKPSLHQVTGTYTLTYSYLGDGAVGPATATSSIQINYGIRVLTDLSHPVRHGSVLTLRLNVVDAGGLNFTANPPRVSIASFTGPGGKPINPRPANHRNAHGQFVYETQPVLDYYYQLNTAGLAPGTYRLSVRVGTDPMLHTIVFKVK